MSSRFWNNSDSDSSSEESSDSSVEEQVQKIVQKKKKAIIEDSESEEENRVVKTLKVWNFIYGFRFFLQINLGQTIRRIAWYYQESPQYKKK